MWHHLPDTDHLAIPWLYRNPSQLVRLAGKDPVPPCSTGIERRSSSPLNHPDRSIRPNLLLGDLSVGGISRCSSLDWQKAEKVTLLLFSRSLPPTLRGIGNIHHHPGGRSKFHRNSICSLQCLRAYRKQPVPTHLAVGKQPVRPFSRTGRQLCILWSRHLDKKSAYFHCSRGYFCHPDIIGMAERTHLLQYNLPGRDGTGISFTLLLVPHHNRYGKMQ